MSRSSGFVPITYKVTGQFLFFLATVVIVLRIITGMTGWFVLPSIIFWAGVILVPISMYLMFYAPKLDGQADEPPSPPSEE